MRIVIDCFKLIKGSGKSIGIYNAAKQLIKNLIDYKKTTDDINIKNAEIVIIGNEFNRCDFDNSDVEFVPVKAFNPTNKMHCIVWELFAVSSFVKKLHADKVIFPRGFCALTHPVEDIVIIHDMIPFYYDEHYPDVFNKLENKYIMCRLKSSAKKCKKIFTDSEASKKEIVSYCKINSEKITVIHIACNDLSAATVNPETKPYISAITSGLPHKNAKAIFKSYEKYCELVNSPLPLTVIGVDSCDQFNIEEKIKQNITCHKYIKEDRDLHNIIANSRIFLFLSLVEGFGFPPIEAMQLNVPVICSNLSSLPEVVGDAAVLVNPNNYNEVAEAMADLIANTDLRSTLIEKGNCNIKRFSNESRAELYWKAILY